MTRYPLRPLGEVLELDSETVPVDAADTYNVAGVYSFGRGIFARGSMAGTDTRYTSLHRLQAGQFVISRLKAFEGAVAIVPPEFDGWFLSQEFPAVRITDRADTRFIAYLCRWPDFWQSLQRASKGVGARRERVHPERLLTIEVPLPAIKEQRRVAAKLDAILGRLARVQALAQTRASMANSLRASLAHRPDIDPVAKRQQGWAELALGDVLQLAVHSVEVDPAGEYPIAGINGFGRGLFQRSILLGSDTKYGKLHRLREGQVVMSRLKAWEGAVAVVPMALDGWYVSPEFPTFDVNTEKATIGFLSAVVTAPVFWRGLISRSKGVGARRERVSAERFLECRVWIPPNVYQHAVDRVIERMRVVAHLCQHAMSRLEALEPAILNQAFTWDA